MLNYNFDWNLFISGEYKEWILSGLLVTLQLSGVAMICSFVMGLILAVMKSRHIKFIRGLATAYLELIRNTPLLVQIFFWYFGSYKLLPMAWNEWLNNTNHFEFIAGAIALSVYTSAFIAEDIRSGIRGIPKEQMEAGVSSGLSFLQIMRWIILPQAVRFTIPPLINQFLNLTKNSSLAMTIGVAELTYQARQIESHTLKGFEAFSIATLIYLLVSLLITAAMEIYNRKVLSVIQVRH